MSRNTFGAYFKECRIGLGIPLRPFCRLHGFDPGNVSRIERDLAPAPQSKEKLAEYAKALGLRRDSDEWYEFFDRAAAEHGSIPKDLLSDKEVVSKLPVLFRTLRGQRVPKSQLDALVEKIRRA